MTTKWNVEIGETVESISSDLLRALGYGAPYTNDETNIARYDNPYTRATFSLALAEAVSLGKHGDEAAMTAIRLNEERKAAQSLETARQKVAELEAKAAADNRAAEGMALARQKRESEA